MTLCGEMNSEEGACSQLDEAVPMLLVPCEHSNMLDAHSAVQQGTAQCFKTSRLLQHHSKALEHIFRCTHELVIGGLAVHREVSKESQG